jgi:hypothetical protein
MASDDLDLTAQAQESLTDPHGYVHDVAVDALKPIAEMAVVAWLARNPWARFNVSSGIELEADGTPVGYAEVSGYFLNSHGRTPAAPAVAFAQANKAGHTQNVEPVLRGIMQKKPGSFRPATGIFLKTFLWQSAKAFGTTEVL